MSVSRSGDIGLPKILKPGTDICDGEDLPVMATKWSIWEMSGHRTALEYELLGCIQEQDDSGRLMR